MAGAAAVSLFHLMLGAAGGECCHWICVLHQACCDIGKTWRSSWAFGSLLGGEARACSIQKVRTSKSCQRLLLQEQHSLLSPWSSASCGSPPRYGRAIFNHAVAVCACETSWLFWQSLWGKGRALHGSDYLFFSIGVIAAKYWEGKRDCDYGRGMRLGVVDPDPSDSDSVSCFLYNIWRVLRYLFNIALELLCSFCQTYLLCINQCSLNTVSDSISNRKEQPTCQGLSL